MFWYYAIIIVLILIVLLRNYGDHLLRQSMKYRAIIYEYPDLKFQFDRLIERNDFSKLEKAGLIWKLGQVAIDRKSKGETKHE